MRTTAKPSVLSMAATVVSVKQGRLRGVEGESVKGNKFVKFLGIPYAEPPVGDLRFKAPVPAGPWSGERDGSKEGNPCYCYDDITGQLGGSEDCLYLNVFTKAVPRQDAPSSDLKPVMVWIHGGGFTLGSSTTQLYGPEVLMAKDIVLVTINYRLGILGFLSSDDVSLEVPGNAGLKDQVLALKWVQENIRSFGGDANNVTIFGESAGGASVHLLCMSPSTNGLFHKAIAMSASVLNPWVMGRRNLKDAARVLKKEVQTEKEALEVLKNATVEELNQAQRKLPDILADATTLRPFAVVVEPPNPTAFLDKEPRDIIANGSYNHVPFMTGMTNNEGLILDMLKLSLGAGDQHKVENFVPYDLRLRKGDERSKRIAAKIDQYYLQKEDGIYDLVMDVLFTRGIVEGVEKQAKNTTQPIYLYKISVETKLAFAKNLCQLTKPGVCHGDELGLLFHVKFTERDCQEGSLEEKSSDKMVALFTNFAKYGNPTPSAEEFGVTWPPVADSANLNYLDIGEELSLEVTPFPERVAFWKEIALNARASKL